MTDILAMGIGFLLAARLPVPVVVGLALGFALLAGWLIRDGLGLNVLMLLLDAVRAWQAAGMPAVR